MAERELELSIIVRAYNYAKEALGSAVEQVEQLNKAVKDTSHFREAAANVGMIGAALAGAGAAIALPLKGAVEEYGNVQQSLIHLGTALDEHEDRIADLAKAHEFAAQASLKFNVAQEDVIQNLFLGASFGLSFKQSLDNASVALAVAKGGMGDAAEVGKATAVIMNDFGDSTKDAAPQLQHFGDVLAYATRHFAFANVGQLTSGISESIGAAKAAGLSYEDLVATLSAFNKVGLQGSEAGAAVIETLQAIGRGGFAKAGVEVARFNDGAIDVIGSLRNLQEAAHRTGDVVQLEMFQRLSKALGARGTRALAVNAEDLANIREQLTPENVGGAAASGAAQMMSAYNEQVGLVSKSWDLLKDQIGEQLAPTIQILAQALSKVVQWFAAAAEAHPLITKLAVTFAAISAALLIIGGGLAALIGGAVWLAGMAGVSWALATTLTVVGATIAGIGTLLVAFGPTVIHALGSVVGFIEAHWQTGLVAALTGPFGIAVLAIRHFFPQFYDAGVNLLKQLGEGMLSALSYPIHAISEVATRIRAHLPFSPAKEGPLSDLGNVKISQTIAERIQAEPIAAAMRRALGRAVNVELSGFRGIAAAVAPLALATFAPTFAGGTGPLPASRGQIVVNMTINISGEAAQNLTEDGLKGILAESGRDIARRLHEQDEIDARSRF